jgi:hypothetical protein
MTANGPLRGLRVSVANQLAFQFLFGTDERTAMNV